MPISTKIGLVVTYNEELPFIKSHDPSVRGLKSVTRQTKTIKSPLPGKVVVVSWLGRVVG